MTATPLINSVTDLPEILDFVAPGSVRGDAKYHDMTDDELLASSARKRGSDRSASDAERLVAIKSDNYGHGPRAV